MKTWCNINVIVCFIVLSLLATVRIVFSSSIYGFWFPLWYIFNLPLRLLISPLVYLQSSLTSFDFPFGISLIFPYVFWFPLWYIFNLPLCYLQSSLMLSSIFPYVIFNLPLCYLQLFLSQLLNLYLVKVWKIIKCVIVSDFLRSYSSCCCKKFNLHFYFLDYIY